MSVRHSSRHFRRILLLFALMGVVALLLPSVSSAAAAPSTSIKLSQNAVLVVPNQLNVEVALNCTAGYTYFVNVDVVEPTTSGFTIFGGGSNFGQCTGQQQKIAVSVFSFCCAPPWQLGDASATASVGAGPSDTDTKTIHITM
jgi:hypothetical protein